MDPTALAEFVPAVLLLAGIMTRILSVMLSDCYVGHYFLRTKSIKPDEPMGYEFPLVLLASALLITTGAGRINFLIKKRCQDSYINPVLDE